MRNHRNRNKIRNVEYNLIIWEGRQLVGFQLTNEVIKLTFLYREVCPIHTGTF